MDFAEIGLGMLAGVLLMVFLLFITIGLRDIGRNSDDIDDLRKEVKDLRGQVDGLRQTTESMHFKVDTFYAPYNSVPVPCTGMKETTAK